MMTPYRPKILGQLWSSWSPFLTFHGEVAHRQRMHEWTWRQERKLDAQLEKVVFESGPWIEGPVAMGLMGLSEVKQ